MELKIIEMAALGRSLYPGMLYDCRSDTCVPGVTLWDKESLTQDLDVRRQPETHLSYSASDSLCDKASFLDVSTSLKASFLVGLVEVGGSAKYLNDQKSSAHQSRVTLRYSQIIRFEQLTMTQLGNVTHPEVFEEKTATHVVTAVLYGSQVIMVFDRTTAENENKQEVEENLMAMVRKIASFSIEEQGALKMNEKEKKLAESISCTVYGDCVLTEEPTTYIEALQLYKKLPFLLRQKENDAVPHRIWLYPLAQLDSRAARLVREIDVTVVSKIDYVLETLGDAERRLKDILKIGTVNDFQDVKTKLDIFQKSLDGYKVLFKRDLCRLLPAIRGGEMNAQALTDILLMHYRSPFSDAKLMQWLEKVQVELNLLNSYSRELSGVPVITSPVLFSNILCDPRVDTVVCFTFTSLKFEDPYLSSMTEVLSVTELQKLSPVLKSSDQDTPAWFSNPDIIESMKKNLFLFRGFLGVNKENEKIRFVIASVSDSSNPGTSIRLYRKGKMVDSKFQPVSKPPAPSVDIQNRNVILNLQKSPTGVTVCYRVEYRVTKPDDLGADGENWEVTDTPDAQETFTLTGLQLENQYQVRYRAVSDVGIGEASDSVLLSLQDEFVEFIPEVMDLKVKNSNLYRFQCPHDGQFQCKFTSLVFEMEANGEVLYRIDSWDTRLLDGLGQMQPAGPLYNIDCIEGSVSCLHLPHCEILSGENQAELAVAHFTGDNVDIIQPLKVTNTHVIISIQGFSLFGLLKSIFLPASPVKAQILLFYKVITEKRTRKKLHMHLLSGNVPADEVKNQHMGFRNIHTSSKCQLTPGKKYRPSCDPYTYQPKVEIFDCDYSPNYHPTFEVFLDLEAEDVTVALLDEDGQEIWEPRLVLLTDYGTEAASSQMDSTRAAFVEENRERLIQKVSSVVELADGLLHKHMMTGEMYSSIQVAKTSQEQMRILYRALDSGGTAVKVEFFQILKKKLPFLVDELEAGASQA